MPAIEEEADAPPGEADETPAATPAPENNHETDHVLPTIQAGEKEPPAANNAIDEQASAPASEPAPAAERAKDNSPTEQLPTTSTD
jgi:hypothetical protein